jgi:hypothetical protein
LYCLQEKSNKKGGIIMRIIILDGTLEEFETPPGWVSNLLDSSIIMKHSKPAPDPVTAIY